MKKMIFMAAAAAFALAACSGRDDISVSGIAVGDVSQRIGYFASHGWEVEEISEKTITIPESFSDVYEE